ncbi:MAG TPA: aminodeoxychorismate synthase component I [Nevskiaceae bacterium]|nr:aminodeoxychorismate synthase component I [Nevskiaceae bacterium]
MSFRAEVTGQIDLFNLHRQQPEVFPFLLQSLGAGSGRYDLLFAFPGDTIEGPEFFAGLNQQAAAKRCAPQDELPFCGGWFLLLGYEAARWIEPRLRLPASPHSLPDALAVRCTAVAVYDHQRRSTTAYAESSQAELDEVVAALRSNLGSPAYAPGNGLQLHVQADVDGEFEAGVRSILEYLKAGDVFQVNLSRAWRAWMDQRSSYLDLYARLRHANPAPFAGLARWGDAVLLSSSPERLVEIRDGWVQTRPIAGTRPRGNGTGEDEQLRAALIASVKERAEHIMLIDLERNDLGRVCQPGSVEVSELMTIESYAHVHHIVSNVRGRLRAEAGPGDVLRAVFPGGTITGCPKVRAMEIIAELECVGRGPYTGAMGYLSRCGRMDTNILIRSLLCESDTLTFRTGAGIVADSDPQAELAETRAKARGLLLALGAQP